MRLNCLSNFDNVWLASTPVGRKDEQLMNLPLCVDPNHNPGGFVALGRLVEQAGYAQPLAVAVIPTVSDRDSEPFFCVNAPAWTETAGLDTLTPCDRFMVIMEQYKHLPIKSAFDWVFGELVERTAEYGRDTNRPYWVVALRGPMPDRIQAALEYSAARISADELCRIIRELLRRY